MLLHVPECLVSAQDTEASISPFEASFLVAARSLTWRGKHQPPQFWWRGWLTAPWIRLLAGLILPPSMLQNYATNWISWLLDSRVNLSLFVARDSAKMTPAGYSGTTLTDAVTGARGKDWSTPRASSHGKDHGRTLAGDSAEWSTPHARDWKAGGYDDTLSRQSEATTKDGENGFDKEGQRQPRLSPRFVCALQGLPVWWTAIFRGATNCECSATESSDKPRLSPSETSSDDSRRTHE